MVKNKTIEKTLKKGYKNSRIIEVLIQKEIENGKAPAIKLALNFEKYVCSNTPQTYLIFKYIVIKNFILFLTSNAFKRMIY